MSEQQPVYYSDASDPDMVAANDRARETFKYFWRELSWERRRIVPGLDLACVKLEFAEQHGDTGEDVVEHMWITDIDFDGEMVSGSLANAPNWLKNVAQGDHVAVPLSRIGDWMFAIAGKIHGGFTVHVMRSRMSAQERRAHDEAWGLEFGDRAVVVHAGSDTGGRTGLLGRLFSTKGSDVAACEAAAMLDHPMSINVESSVRETLASQPEMVHQRDDDGWTILHRESLAGNRNIVRVLLEHGADRACRTPEGFTALDLARRLDWTGTIEVLVDFPERPS